MHTPLQLLAATNLRLQYKLENSILIYEGSVLQSLVIPSLWEVVYEGWQSRTVTHQPGKAIRFNLCLLHDVLERFTPDNVCLYISELQWMCNKAFYAMLRKKFPNSLKVCFLDEGLHFYINNKKFSEETKLKTWLKFIWMRLHGLPSTHEYTYQFYKKKRVQSLYAYHPNLFEPELYANAEVFKLDADYLSKYTNKICTIEHDIGAPKELLFLSQAYYWDIPESSFKEVVVDMVSYFRAKGVEQFYVKPHHSDTVEWIDYLCSELGFQITKLPQNMPIEIYARQLKYECLVSISSSALLNLKTFGYEGSVLSYGMMRCSLTKKYTQIHKKLLSIFQDDGVTIIG